MEHWQFLIQKQGDRSWHALESPNTEILEGRYRVLARSSLPNQDVEVRVTYFSPQEVPPKRRIQKRLRRTNSEGLMAVIPFTYLKPGIWELRCSGDLISDILGKSWQYGVHLQVNSQDADEVEQELEIENTLEIDSFHQPDSVSDENLTSNSGTELTITNESYFLSTGLSLDRENTAIDEPVSPVWVKGETAEQILQNLIDLALPTSELLLEETKIDDSPTSEPSLPLLLTLDRETYITRWGHLLTIHGNVALQKNLEQADKTDKTENLQALELRIELRSPLSSGILTQLRQSLGEKSLPITIRSVIDIPADCESKLILADIKLYGVMSYAIPEAKANPGEVTLLASHSFTITADVADLLAVKNAVKTSPVDEQNDIMSGISTAETPTSLDLELFNLVKTSSPRKLQSTIPSVNAPLPGQIEPQSLNKSADFRLPQLPKLPDNPTDGIAPSDLATEVTSELPPLEQNDTTVPQAPAPINLDQLLIKARPSRILGSTLPYLKRLPAEPSSSEVKTSQIAEELIASVVEELPQVDNSITEPETSLEDVLSDIEVHDAVEEELESPPIAEVIETLDTDTSTTESAAEPLTEFIDENVSAISIAPSLPYSSPLIRKWMERQGYSFPEDDFPQEQNPTEESAIISLNPEIPEFEDTSLSDLLAEAVETDLTTPEVTENQISVEIENISPESLVLQVELPTTEPTYTASSWLAQEFVVDDSDSEPELQTNKNQLPKTEQQEIANTIDASQEILEPLPIPQLYVPDGELIAGTLVRMRVELPQVSPQVVVKLWMEDCQTRWLLDGPHLIKELLQNSSGNLEAMTQINIPFGCMEIRIEAIALNTATQQESHKVTIVKTVIPPDLPNVSLNDLLGM
ncbi:hypothetical protein [Nostoc parmelioides]|uniref:Uncharacterized protein n=1 Tax=Nostoc parmelioides FACHB-3921 TaxID=2692909 RepID=A0ABR8BMD5_9NOSO|nr:hypothetical protein [Nostoc parmelioides]MBD2255282.1 hypothetical protein [Nostoc parmelioides FACHB-3921]